MLGRPQKIEQPATAIALEGTSFKLNCSLSSVTTEKVLWYRQVSSQGPQYIAGVYPGYQEKIPTPNSTVDFPKDKKSTTLELHPVTLGEAAVYYCALSDAQRGSMEIQYNGPILIQSKSQ
uniref:Uncharacterized protein n=1 Tax=Sphaerodactylus townsendi TaxID=933632 RepID=A0ACB8EWQ2_9SAUR